MARGRFEKRRRRRFGRAIALVLALTLVLGGAIGGTLAWLTDETDEVENVFTTSNIEAGLQESDNLDLKMVPGCTITKDPEAWVTDGSEDCYLFVKVEETGVSFTPDGETMPKVYSFDDFLTYEIAEGWTRLEDGVYYKVFNSKDNSNTNVKGTEYPILKDDQVVVKDTVTEEMMNDLETYEVNPTLTFTAYAVQYWKDNTTPFTAAEAWANAQDAANS